MGRSRCDISQLIVIKVKYKAVSNKQPFKADWRTVKEFFKDAEINLRYINIGRWSIESGLVYVERSYENNDEWEKSIDTHHKRVNPIRAYRFEIVEETNGDEDGISS